MSLLNKIIERRNEFVYNKHWQQRRIFRCRELERRGFTVAVPMSNTKDFDILAINRETNRQVALQVKTNRGKGKYWLLNKKSEELKGDNIYYVLLCLNELEQPEYYIVESELIADNMQKGYQQWLQEEGKKEKRHETTMRKFAFDVLGVNNVLGLKSYDYKDKWEKLK